jgi:hypothetical protein
MESSEGKLDRRMLSWRNGWLVVLKRNRDKKGRGMIVFYFILTWVYLKAHYRP